MVDTPSRLSERDMGMAPGECDAALAKALSSRTVERMLSNLRKLQPIQVSAVECPDGERLRGYFQVPPGDRVTLCCNLLRNGKALESTLTHELVHAHDHTQGMDFHNPMHLACSEIRAASLVDCAAYPWPFKRMCVRRTAENSTRVNFGAALARECVGACIGVCYVPLSEGVLEDLA